MTRLLPAVRAGWQAHAVVGGILLLVGCGANTTGATIARMDAGDIPDITEVASERPPEPLPPGCHWRVPNWLDDPVFDPESGATLSALPTRDGAWIVRTTRSVGHYLITRLDQRGNPLADPIPLEISSDCGLGSSARCPWLAADEEAGRYGALFPSSSGCSFVALDGQARQLGPPRMIEANRCRGLQATDRGFTVLTVRGSFDTQHFELVLLDQDGRVAGQTDLGVHVTPPFFPDHLERVVLADGSFLASWYTYTGTDPRLPRTWHVQHFDATGRSLAPVVDHGPPTSTLSNRLLVLPDRVLLLSAGEPPPATGHPTRTLRRLDNDGRPLGPAAPLGPEDTAGDAYRVGYAHGELLLFTDGHSLDLSDSIIHPLSLEGRDLGCPHGVTAMTVGSDIFLLPTPGGALAIGNGTAWSAVFTLVWPLEYVP